MSKSEEVKQEKDIKPKRSYKKHSLKMIQKLKRLVYVYKMTKNRAAELCQIPKSTAKKILAEYQKAQKQQKQSLKRTVSPEIKEIESEHYFSYFQTETQHDQSFYIPFSPHMLWVLPQYYYQ